VAISLADRAPAAATVDAGSTHDPKASNRGSAPAHDARTPFTELVHALGHEAERGEATVRSVMRGAVGRDLSSTDLLALQAGIYRYGETIDLAAKLVDKAGTDVRTVLQGSQ
jgi:hypothetical protein